MMARALKEAKTGMSGDIQKCVFSYLLLTFGSDLGRASLAPSLEASKVFVCLAELGPGHALLGKSLDQLGAGGAL
jgi:hypothetical protein